ncbi:MAG TPA: hypothetical protein DC058_22720 [Planctomycetaceae bacterium]|nr:hypothetical protein [Planctomycetaceae bacterium]HBC64015.1 hypothetical protein [Planctomycetaceae bacterium]
MYPKNTIPDAPFGALPATAYTENALFTLPDASTIRKILANLTPPAHFTGFNSPGCDNPSSIDVASPLCSGPAPMTTEPPKPVTEIPLLAQVLGRVPSGVFILAIAGPDGQKTGLLASWVQQASFNPPQVTVAINKSRWFIDWLAPGTPLILNQVQKGDALLFRHFGKGFEPGSDAFAGVDSTPGQCGLPILQAAMAALEGTVTSLLDAGDHLICLVTLNAAHPVRNPAEFDPFIHVRKNGLSY